jgi:hypothetical protein
LNEALTCANEFVPRGRAGKKNKVEHIHTSKMLADGLMKVFDGKEFVSFCNNLLRIEPE